MEFGRVQNARDDNESLVGTNNQSDYNKIKTKLTHLKFMRVQSTLCTLFISILDHND